MGLIIRGFGPSWAMCADNLTSTPNTAPGTAVPTGSSNADGAATAVLAALTHDCEYLVISILGPSSSASNRSALLDVLVDPAGGTSWATLITDLLCGYSGLVSSTVPYAPAYQYHFPVWIKAGSTVGALLRGTQGGISHQVVIQAFGGNKNPASWACGQKVTTVGTMDTSNSIGQAHTPGNTGTFSSWTSLGSTLATNAIAWQTAMQGSGGTVMSSLAYTFEFGYNSTRIGPRRAHFTGSTEGTCSWASGIAFNSFAAGTQLQVRGTSSGTSNSVDVAAYVVS